MYIQFRFSVYTIQIYLIYMAYAWNILCINILYIYIIYIVYGMDIQFKFYVYTIQIYLIYMVYAWYINCMLQVYTLYMPTLTYPILTSFTCRSILIEQPRSLCFQLSSNLLGFSERERLVCILQLISGTPAACALCRGTHCCCGYLISVHG
jgi:hypothetical protein